jgi:lipoyl synthase
VNLPESKDATERHPKPAWLKVRAPGGETYTKLKRTLHDLRLHTVCEEARCPNVGECWSKGTATVMILGDTCTRGCRFCAVNSGNPRGQIDPDEPEHVALAVAQLGLRYVVITMVDRDDLPDGGAEHVAKTVRALRRVQPQLLVEALVGDFRGNEADVITVLGAKPAVFAHNIEVVRRLTPFVRDKRCSYERSLEVLAAGKRSGAARYIKSSVMVGIGETDQEVVETLTDLRRVGVEVVTLGQYLRPSARHAAVQCYRTPQEFLRWQEIGRELGFAFVASGPLVRSSYHAAEAFVAAGVDRSGPPSAVRTGPSFTPTEQPYPVSDEHTNALGMAGILEISRLTRPR